jgi:hypothetical protein
MYNIGVLTVYSSYVYYVYMLYYYSHCTPALHIDPYMLNMHAYIYRIDSHITQSEKGTL